jgi:hypothetical protein
VADAGVVVMGGDSAWSDDVGDRSLRSPKVFERGGLLFGASGVMRIGQLIRHVFDIPIPVDGQDMEEYMVRDFCGALRPFLKDGADDLLPTQESEDELWELLVGVRARLFNVCSHMCVSESATSYDAIGSGAPQALGSLASTEGRPGPERVEVALRAAERHNGGVAAPFTVLTSPARTGPPRRPRNPRRD